MKTQTKTLAFAFGLFAALAILVGCSSDGNVNSPSTGDDPEGQTVNLDDPFGGFLAVDEAPAFGDNELAGSVSDEEELDEEEGYDGLNPDERVRAKEIETSAKRQFFSLTVLWGRLGDDAYSVDPPSMEGAVVWDGSMSLERTGAIRVLSLIKFEPPEDQLGRPRLSAEELDWTSVTHGHYDGLRVLLVVPGDDSTAIETAGLHFEAEPFGEIDFSIAQLDSLAEVYDIAETGEQISFHAFRTDPNVDVRGFCGGRWGWGWAEDDSVGRFRGRWVSCNGQLRGFMRGHYGLNADGDKVFFGKYIDKNGRFKGFLRGRWDVLSCGGQTETPDYKEIGGFWGEWVGRHGNAIGHLSGHWSRRGNMHGVFTGIWRGGLITP